MRPNVQKNGYKIINYQYDLFSNAEYNRDIEHIYRRVNFFNKARVGLWIDEIRINKLVQVYEFKGNRDKK